jgi:hypothetical protein
MIEVNRMSHPISSAIQQAESSIRRIDSTRRAALLTLIFLLLVLFSAAAQEPASTLPDASGVSAATHATGSPALRVPPHNTNSLAYWYGANYRTPFVLDPSTHKAADIARNTIEFTHVSSAGMLNNFANVSVAMSDMAEPAAAGGAGATEVYVILREGIGLNELAHSSAFTKGPLRNVAFEVGANLETKNSSFSPAERTLYAGPKFVFAVPKGYFNVGVHFRQEWNHEAVLGKAEHYTPNFNIEPTWMLPFRIGKAQLAFSGVAEYNSPKGIDSFGSPTVSEYLVKGVVAVDIGALLMHKPQLVDLNAGLWGWHNEYGKPAADPGAKQLTPLIGVTLHLDGGRARHNP